LDKLSRDGPLLINPIILAKTSVRFERAVHVEAALSILPLKRETLPWDAAFFSRPGIPGLPLDARNEALSNGRFLYRRTCYDGQSSFIDPGFQTLRYLLPKGKLVFTLLSA
jgi:hypothetical protein